VDQSIGQGPNGDCWIWRGAVVPGTGYGQITLACRKLGAHRAAWALANGYWPQSREQICHTCDNPVCVRPDHLWAGTATSNMHDMIAKGRSGGTGAENRVKTHCKHGHAFTPDNLLPRKTKRRDCKKCSQLRRHVRRQGFSL
jgi:hypothetical protein